MDITTIDFAAIADTLVSIIVALGSIFAGVYGCSKKFRNWINNKLKDTDTMRSLTDRQDKDEKKIKSIETHCEQRSKEITNLCNKVEQILDKLDDKVDKLDDKVAKLDQTIDKLDEKVERLEQTVDKLDTKVEKDKDSTILTLKYEILDICSRAIRYNGITNTDKLLLCELYHEYVDVWNENHYVKSEADKVIKTFPVIDEYKR